MLLLASANLLLLSGGLLLWSGMAFFGVSKMLTEKKESPLAEFLFGLRQKFPPVYLIVTPVFGILALVFVYLQEQAIKEFSGIIGPQFMVAVICGVVASISLAALLKTGD